MVSKHREVQDIVIPNVYTNNWNSEWENPVTITVKRPDFALVAHSDYDMGGLLKEVKEVFGEAQGNSDDGSTNKKKHKDIQFYINDLLSRTLVEPTWDDFESLAPLTDSQKMVIIEWVFKEIGQLIDIIRNKNAAWPIIAQCSKFDKLPHEILDPHNEFCGLYHIYFNKAMLEYYIYIEQDMKPIEHDTSGDVVTFLQSIGVKKAKDNESKVSENTVGLNNMTNTAKVLEQMMKTK